MFKSTYMYSVFTKRYIEVIVGMFFFSSGNFFTAGGIGVRQLCDVAVRAYCASVSVR